MVFIDPSLTRSPKLVKIPCSSNGVHTNKISQCTDLVFQGLSICSRCTNTFLSAQIHYFGAQIYFSMHKYTSLRY